MSIQGCGFQSEKRSAYACSLVLLVPVLLVISVLSACSSDGTWALNPFEAAERADIPGINRSYMILGNKRFISGPYGDANEIASVIKHVKKNSTPVTVSNRALNLPNMPMHQAVTVSSYTFPAECGGKTFHVYEGENLQVLQFELMTADPKLVRIRDYVIGPNIFVEAGLWGPYDHADGSMMEMCLMTGKSDEDGLGLLNGAYEVGWVSTLAKWKQSELGIVYSKAVHISSTCQKQIETASGLIIGRTYRVQRGDSLMTIAKRFYGSASLWNDIYEWNIDKIGPDPDFLPFGITLELQR